MRISRSETTEPIPRAHQPRWMVIALLVIFVVMIGGSTLFMLERSYRETLSRSRTAVENLAALLERQLSSIIHEVDLVLIDIADELNVEHLQGSPALEAALQEKLKALPQGRNILVVDKDGRVIAAARHLPTTPASLAGTEGLQRLGQLDAPPTIVSGVLPLGPNGDYGVVAVRRLANNGHFIGAVIISLNSSYFDLAIQPISVGQHGVVSIRDDTLHWLARRPNRPGLIGHALDSDTVLREQVEHSREGSYIVESPVDGVERITAYRVVKEYPFIAVVGLSLDDELATWYRLAWIYACFNTLLLMLALAIAYIFWRDQLTAARLIESQHELRESEEQLRLITRTAPFPLIIVEPVGWSLLYLNLQARELFGTTGDSLEGLQVLEYFAETAERDRVRQLLTEQGSLRDQETELLRMDGTRFWALVSVNITHYKGQDSILIAINDITERKQLEASLLQQALTDSLTGLANRRGFMAKAALEIQRSRRFEHPLSLLMLDIDHFKHINDSLGHPVGDMALQALAGCCLRTMRQIDVVGRLGGEEFGLLLPETDAASAAQVAERLREAIEALRVTLPEGEPLRFTVSIGVTTLKASDGTLDALLIRADQALYRAKNEGRNRVVSSA